VTRAEILERLRPALDVMGEILVDLVEARLAELQPPPAAAAAPDHREFVASVIAEMRASAALEAAAPPAAPVLRLVPGARRDPAPVLPTPSPEARAAAMAARYAKKHGATLERAAILHRCKLDDVRSEWARLYPNEERRAVP
jgi:hypothetical protein